MTDKTLTRRQKSRSATRRHLRNGTLAVILAGLLWSALPGPAREAVEPQRLSQETSRSLTLTAKIEDPTGATVATGEDVAGDLPAGGIPGGNAPGFATTQEPLTETVPPLLSSTPAVPPAASLIDTPMQAMPQPGQATPSMASGWPTLGGSGSSTRKPKNGALAGSGPLFAGAAGPGSSGQGSTGPRGTPSGGVGPAMPPQSDNGAPSAHPDTPLAALPTSPTSGGGRDDAGNHGPAAGSPTGPVAGDPAAPTDGAAPASLPGGSDDPVVAATAPGDRWFSPGHSPGIAEIEGDFALAGGSLLFEILGTAAGVGYDQLRVNGDVNLDSGDVVFAFINGFVPGDPSSIFELIVADSLAVNLSSVNFYYGFFDPDDDPTWAMHAPRDLGLYTLWDASSGIARIIDAGTAGNDRLDGLLAIQYNPQLVSTATAPQQGPDRVIAPLPIGAEVPAPASLLLVATGLLLSGAARRGRREA